MNAQITKQASVSQRTIADHLQVSVATVSKALRGHQDISPEVRHSVGLAAAELGYQSKSRGSTGHSPATGSKLFGLLIRGSIDSGLQDRPTYLSCFTQLASRMNVSVVVQESVACEDPMHILDTANQPPAIRNGVTSGIALGGGWPTEVVHELSKRNKVVLFPQHMVDTQTDSVGWDKIAVMMQVCEKLKRLGHQRIGFFGRCGSMQLVTEIFSSYVNTMDRLGLPLEMKWVVGVDRKQMFDAESGSCWQKNIDQVESMKKNDGVDAWVCCNNWPAYQLYRGMADRGYCIPRDLSIVGFDENEPTNLGCPPVTTVRVPIEEICRATLCLLNGQIDRPRRLPVQLSLPSEIVDHGTIGPPSYATA